ncbi:transporter substrate-binding domain-containing protein [Lysinibacter sp. HNR]|uniref:transporter substrate-binding domain-containing protein n=1 Tax=Lysinibacter sp. HNR TaxID=3031408 RepID=UPI00243511C2|nr:transporter substrate-binding domain-containing protein [Lysinibacter sp. HNR]WGD37102.1 transporter substrate-binding domain-containing protein [Lysinibacter sp. HNR]
MLNKKKIAVIAAGIAILGLAGAGISAAVVTTSSNQKDNRSSATKTDPTVESAYNLGPDQDRVRIDPVTDAVAELHDSGFTPVTPGTLTVAVSPFSPPLSFIATDNVTPVGSETDVAQLVADGLDLQLSLVAVNWADWPLGVQSGKYDAVISNVGVTEERKELFDFASYRRGLHAFAVLNTSPIDSLSEAKDVAGLSIVVASGTNQEKVLRTWSEENVAAGLEPVDLVYFDDEAAGILALESGRVDALFGPNPQAIYRAATGKSTKIVGTVSAGWPAISDVAVGTARGNGLIGPVHTVLKAVITDGTLTRALTLWDLSGEILPASEINPPGLPKP